VRDELRREIGIGTLRADEYDWIWSRIIDSESFAGAKVNASIRPTSKGLAID